MKERTNIVMQIISLRFVGDKKRDKNRSMSRPSNGYQGRKFVEAGSKDFFAGIARTRSQFSGRI